MDSFKQTDSLENQADFLEASITLVELEQAIRTSDPQARFILPRILRRIIKQDRGLTGFAFRVPHRKSYFIDRQRLLEIVEPEEIGLQPDEVLPDKIILLAQPNPHKLQEMTGGSALVQCWRMLFHARVHIAIQQCVAEGKLPQSALRQRIHQLGEVEFEEVRAVLGQEGFLFTPRADLSVYEEFAAVYWELRYFAPKALARYFPALEGVDAGAVLQQDVDAQWLLLSTRPLHAPDPVEDPGADDSKSMDVTSEESPATLSLGWEPPSHKKYRKLMRKAQRPARLGNTVGAAIYHLKALRCSPPEMMPRTKIALKEDLNRLIGRLQRALELEVAEPRPWHDSLRSLVQLSSDGFWTVEARLLYDLQKVCLDNEREISTIDVAEWLLSLGRRPIKRPLPNQRYVLASQHLHSAERRLAAVRLSEGRRKQLGSLIRDALERVEARLRDQFRPLLIDALEAVGLKPDNLPEQVAQNKLVEELLDQAAERGFITLGDLRDALSRNALKMPDIPGPGTLVSGDPLLQADRRLGESLDGVYRPAQFYLRWMQQLSSLAFGTRMGRFLTLNLAVPFGGAFLIQKGFTHLLAFINEDVHAYENYGAMLLWGVFLFGLVNLVWFRKLVGQSLKNAWRYAQESFFMPLWRIIHSHVVQVILHSPLFRISFRFLIKPAFWSALIWLTFPLEGVNWRTSFTNAAIVFLIVNLVLNSRTGRNLEEMSTDWIVQTWNRYGMRFFLGLFWLVVDFFKGVLEALERFMYGVDEWLRFRSGDSAVDLCLKGALGMIWFVVAYIVRFCVTLLLEPQINPIKHFPVVTVSHKLLVPLIPHLAGILETRMGIEKGWAWTLGSTVIFCIPGIFGFLVWELKENWRLYAANRKQGLSPVVIGKHGETMVRLLKPGVHSGTLPKIFAKLRRAERKARQSGNWQPMRKYLHALEHFQVAIRRYVERDFLALLTASKWGNNETISAKEIHLATNRVRFLFTGESSANNELVIDLEFRSGWLTGSVLQAGWIGRLPAEQRQAPVAAILGLYKSAGVALVGQQIQSAFSPPLATFDINERGITAYPDPALANEVFYDLRETGAVIPQVEAGKPPSVLPVLERSQLLFSELQITWQQWVQWWQDYQMNPDMSHPPLAPFPVLPKAVDGLIHRIIHSLLGKLPK